MGNESHQSSQTQKCLYNQEQSTPKVEKPRNRTHYCDPSVVPLACLQIQNLLPIPINPPTQARRRIDNHPHGPRANDP